MGRVVTFFLKNHISKKDKINIIFAFDHKKLMVVGFVNLYNIESNQIKKNVLLCAIVLFIYLCYGKRGIVGRVVQRSVTFVLFQLSPNQVN